MQNCGATCVILSCGLKSEILSDTQLEKKPQVSKDQTVKMKAAFSLSSLFQIWLQQS